MNHYVYILRSQPTGKLYKGYSSDLKDRLRRHRDTMTGTTSRGKPWVLVFYCVFPEKPIALRFEQYLKSGSGQAFLRKRFVGLTKDDHSATIRKRRAS
ncbi:MAG: GIY-YIG nuclease family protein [Candidatus Kerfeldbacteria bacterium]|nr:GIY-YIG nuclease family protein [Candidatus Kerfeldbacteria bacterium]